MAEQILQIQHLSKSFGANLVLKDVDFQVNVGDVTCIIGASGSGKSTLLRCINLLETPSGGEILFHGQSILTGKLDASAYRAKVGMVFQSFNLFNNLSVLDNCMVGQVKVLKRPKEEARKIAMSFLEKVGMAPYVNVLQNQTELSRAQQQVIRVNNDIRNAEVQLNKYLGFSPNRPVNYVGNLKDFPGTVGYTEEEAVKAAVRQRPDLIMARKSVEVAYKDMNIAMGQYLPKVDASYDSMSSSKDYDDKRYEGYTRNYWAAGLNFSWEIFSGGGTTFSTLAERKRAQALQKDYEDAMSGARADVIRALLDITAARELIATSRKGVDAARESYAMANKRYMTNTGTITELLDAQLKLTQAENDASRALAEYHSARVRFFYYIGRENPGLK